MATGWQLRQFDENKQKFKLAVAAVQKENAETLFLAAAQLAVSLTEAALRGQPVDITQRDDFDSANPNMILSAVELERLPEANIIVVAIGSFVSTSIRLQNREKPQVHGTGVTEGRI
jgi:hypothetical protein